MAQANANSKAVLLDVDGTLIDSNDAHATCWVETLTAAGYHVPFSRIRELIGKGGDKLLPDAVGLEKDSPEYTALVQRRSALFKDRFLPHLKPFPRARDLVQELGARGFRLVVASSATAEEIHALLAVADVRDLVQDVKSSRDAAHSKPDPDIVVAALKAAGCAPSQAIMLGDTPYDIEAAANAGVTTIAFRCGGWDDQSLRGATAIYDDPSDLMAHLDGSPLVAS
jgi:HAD superfamily hydrolase (TIGR01509 family)